MSAVFRSLRLLPTPSSFSSSLILPVSYRTRAFGKPNRSLRWSETTLGKSDLFVSKRARCSGGGARSADVRCVAPKDGRVFVVPNARYTDHFSFIEDVAAARAPESLNHLLNMLQARGEALISPAAKEGLIPLVIPLSESPSGKLTSLLRWPTSPPGMEMPVVEVHKHGVWLLAKSVDQYIHRMLVEEDANVENSNKLWDASAEAGQKLYKKDDLSESGIADLDIYLLKKVGLFPDVIERKISRHLEKGDQVSAMITGEFYTKQHFPGFGRPFAFNAQILLKVGRNLEAKDAARGALKSPWWTLGFKYQDVADIAEWEDEQIEYIKEKITEEGRMEDLKKGKAPEQVALDEAAFLMDLASIDGSWNEVVDRIAECYMEAGLHDIAKFIAFRE
ncbi:protein IN CHLOROPLAST ATPASE BIOGENESIS, chloroplastic-like [Zingiber officinale]|uniref:protein IN CHLOROPLAST ATPASE BIOGENESIS, chloroplastic-like n=1 Tax=Zingiber officinale TaxID=94328 RepID=UPI001C4B7223|nr:protein IN CHLOROPLAST ATPASE BIOGENESIS, chloroplastic-like [Zingiber officinale]